MRPGTASHAKKHFCSNFVTACFVCVRGFSEDTSVIVSNAYIFFHLYAFTVSRHGRKPTTCSGKRSTNTKLLNSGRRQLLHPVVAPEREFRGDRATHCLCHNTKPIRFPYGCLIFYYRFLFRYFRSMFEVVMVSKCLSDKSQC